MRYVTDSGHFNVLSNLRRTQTLRRRRLVVTRPKGDDSAHPASARDQSGLGPWSAEMPLLASVHDAFEFWFEPKREEVVIFELAGTPSPHLIQADGPTQMFKRLGPKSFTPLVAGR